MLAGGVLVRTAGRTARRNWYTTHMSAALTGSTRVLCSPALPKSTMTAMPASAARVLFCPVVVADPGVGQHRDGYERGIASEQARSTT